MNGHYLRDAPDDELFDILIATLPYLQGGEAMLKALDETKCAQLRAALPGLKARAKTLDELVDGAGFLFVQRPLPMDEKAQKLLSPDAKSRLAALGPKLAALSEWTAAATEAVVRDLSVERGVKLGDLAQPLRAALTGRSTSPGIFDVLEILGREESLARIADQSA
jgi:glutamyl-tRNA synthetase